MNTFYTVYTLTDCSFCKKSINLLEQKNVPFVVVVLDKNPQFLEKVKQDMGHKTVPIVIQQLEDSTISIIGGSDDLERHFLNEDNLKSKPLLFGNET